jgi:hypothetical protein
MVLNVNISDTSEETKPNAAFTSQEHALQILFSAAMNIYVVERERFVEIFIMGECILLRM